MALVLGRALTVMQARRPAILLALALFLTPAVLGSPASTADYEDELVPETTLADASTKELVSWSVSLDPKLINPKHRSRLAEALRPRRYD